MCFIIGGLLFIGSILWQYFLERQQSSPNGAKHRILIVDPLIPVEILRSYDVCATAFASFAGGMLMLVIFYFVAIFMTIVLDLSPSDAGVQLLYFLPGMVYIYAYQLNLFSRFTGWGFDSLYDYG